MLRPASRGGACHLTHRRRATAETEPAQAASPCVTLLRVRRGHELRPCWRAIAMAATIVEQVYVTGLSANARMSLITPKGRRSPPSGQTRWGGWCSATSPRAAATACARTRPAPSRDRSRCIPTRRRPGIRVSTTSRSRTTVTRISPRATGPSSRSMSTRRPTRRASPGFRSVYPSRPVRQACPWDFSSRRCSSTRVTATPTHPDPYGIAVLANLTRMGAAATGGSRAGRTEQRAAVRVPTDPGRRSDLRGQPGPPR